MFKLLRLAGLGATLLLVTAGPPALVSAHAEYDHSDPADGATLVTPPSMVKVWFTEGVKSGAGSSLKVQNSAGQQVDNSDSKVDTSDPDRQIMTVSLRPGLPSGTYTVAWNTVSADDGEADQGDFSFSVRSAAAPAAPSVAVSAAQPAAAARPSPAQVPGALPRSGEGEPSVVLLAAVLGGLMVLTGLVVRRSLKVRQV
jgi:copper transport protein